MLVYYGKSYDNAYKVGDQLKVVGESDSYNYGPQIGHDYVEKMSDGQFSYPAAEELTGSDLDALLTEYVDSQKLLDVKYVKITGQLSVSGSHYNLIVNGAEKAQGSLYNPISDFGLAAMNGQTKTVYGYMTSISGGKYVNLVVTSVE